MGEIKYPLELDKLIDTCRKKGVKSIKIEGLELELREEAPLSNYKRKKLEVVSSDKIDMEPELDPLFWSADSLISEESAG